MVVLLGVFAAVIGSIFLCAYLVWRQRGFFSRLMDRFHIRPSRVSGGLLIGCGLFMLQAVIVFPPDLVVGMQLLNSFFAAVFVATGVDRFLNPPAKECRPPWYEGKGDPNWIPLEEALLNRKFSFRLSWIGTAIAVLCVALALFSSKARKERERNQRQRNVITRIEEMGGTVQQGRVTLAGTEITDADLGVLTELEIVRELNVGATKVSNEGLKLIGQLRELSKLNLSGTQVDDDGLAYLAELNNLGELHLRKTDVTGTGFPFRSGSRTLILDLSLCPVTKEGLHKVCSIPLLHLDLSETDVDDSILPELKKLGRGSLDIKRTKVSKEGSEELRTTKPNLFWSPRK